jgi:TonB-dependent receptor
MRLQVNSLAFVSGALVISTWSASATAQVAQPPEPTSVAQSNTQSRDQEEEKLQEIVVTGYARSLAKSVADKRDAEVISDTISSEDIGKFPEENIAESLQRITGVQITRSQGEGQFVSLRGLDPKFTAITLNGLEVPSPTGSRTFDMTILSADFINALQVYKSPTADMSEGGLAGTVNIQTIRPIEYGMHRLAVTAEGNYDDQAKKGVQPHVAAIYTTTWADNTWGLVAGADYSKRQLNVQAYNAYGMQPFVPGQNGALDLNSGQPYKLQNATYLDENIGTRSRQSVMSTLEFRPNEAFEGRLDLLYSKFKNDTYLPANAQRQVDALGPPNPAGVYVDPSTGYVLGYSAQGVDLRNNARSNYYLNTLKSAALGGTLSLGGWVADGEVAYSRAEKRFTDYSLEVLARPSGFYDLRTDLTGIPTLGFNPGVGPNPLDPNSFYAIGFNGDVDAPTSDRLANARFDISRDIGVGWVSKLHFGFDYTDRRFATGSRQLAVTPAQICSVLGCTTFTAPDGSPAFNAAPWMQAYGGSNFMSGYGGPSTFPKTWLAANPFSFLGALPLSRLLALSPLTQNQTSVSATDEKVYSGYVKLNFASADQRWSGNIGVRFVRTDQAAQGYAPDFAQGIKFTQQGARTETVATFAAVDNSYNEVLPSFNLSYRITGQLIARFAAAKVMQRPDLNLIAPTTTINANVNSINQGNPRLKPYLANQFDLSLEWYFNDRSLLSADVFYKDVSNFVVSTQFNEDLAVINIDTNTTSTHTFAVSQPGNGGGTKIKGVEIGYQQPFTFLPGVFSGLGAMANYTHIDADPAVVAVGQAPLPLPGVSKNSANAGVYFENLLFGAHLLYNYRSQYVVDAQSYFGDGDYVKAYGQLDLSANYNFGKYVSLTGTVTNLTNEPIRDITKYGISRNYELDGRRYALGLHVSF